MKKLFVGAVLSLTFVFVMIPPPAFARQQHNPGPETTVVALEMPVIVQVMRVLDEKYGSPGDWRAHGRGVEKWLSAETLISIFWNGQYSVQKNVSMFGVRLETLEKGTWEDLLR